MATKLGKILVAGVFVTAVGLCAAVVVVLAWLATPIKHPLDAAPQVMRLSTPLAAGVYEAELLLEWHDDHLNPRRELIAVVVSVRVGGEWLTQTLANCYMASKTDVAASQTGVEMDAADCDGVPYYLILTNGHLLVRRGGVTAADEVVSDIPLP